ncbi:unnamed protein product [Adineta ricciae]|uniref:NHL repeat containing protein-like protein n=1 Tax=Adineta ricciae TaxID=249248 RepID=A0A815RNM7_ADIRI|nr:unnamed protein product [Adineta ricciae]
MKINNMNCTTRIGSISDAKYVSNDTITVIEYNNSCSECLCKAFFSSLSPSYVGLNCYMNNKTCYLFVNYSSSGMVVKDINTKFIFKQAPPFRNVTEDPFPLSGITVAGYGNGSAGNTNKSLKNPFGLALDAADLLFVADYSNSRVMRFQPDSLTGTIVAGTGVRGTADNQLGLPGEIAVDASENVYIYDDLNYRVMLWRANATNGTRVAGTGTNGSTNENLSSGMGLTRDSLGNLYVSDKGNHRIMKWTPNATVGTLFAGTGRAGNAANMLRYPYGLFLDENNSYLYVTDSGNARIQRFNLSNGTIGTTVAGGYGIGLNSSQLYNPYDVCVSKSGDIYIADKSNHRIQLWKVGATTGITIIGMTGITGTNATLLYGPSNVLLSANESFLYVSDNDNNRVQRYKLP